MTESGIQLPRFLRSKGVFIKALPLAPTASPRAPEQPSPPVRP